MVFIQTLSAASAFADFDQKKKQRTSRAVANLAQALEYKGSSFVAYAMESQTLYDEPHRDRGTLYLFCVVDRVEKSSDKKK
jgi:hypothetical protein